MYDIKALLQSVSGIYCHKTGKRPPSCVKPQQPTIDDYGMFFRNTLSGGEVTITENMNDQMGFLNEQMCVCMVK